MTIPHVNSKIRGDIQQKKSDIYQKKGDICHLANL